ncbi:hypothetical protein N805_06225 [Pseudomonas putida S13.1.2]|uniref:Uncharacterized protein n=1 Tax=Pseudomonas putida S13.1.2 TaxID=1384061 RepID=A0AAU8S1M0_PSEPU|nr:hypothetical protein N805_06225 [Pseudomonas putida S13.1.2]
MCGLARQLRDSGNLVSVGVFVVFQHTEMNPRWTASQQTKKSQQFSELMRIRLLSTVGRLCYWATVPG